MPENYKALREFHQYVFGMLCRVREVDGEEMVAFEDAFSAAKSTYPTLFGPDEVAGTNIRAPHFKEFTTAERMKNFMALELGIDLESYSRVLWESNEEKRENN